MKWTKLRAMPHMNSLCFIVAPEHSNDPHFGPRTALHEMGHAWLAYFTGHTITPESWRRDEHAVAYLASGFGHWHTTWVDDDLPGLMATKPTSGRFNAFDLYALGLNG